MGRVSDMAIGLQENARDELLCEIDHWKERAGIAAVLLESIIRDLPQNKDWLDPDIERAARDYLAKVHP